MEKEIQLECGEDGKFRLRKEPYCTIEVQSKEDFETLQKAVLFYSQYGEKLASAHGPLVDLDAVNEILENSHKVSDGEYGGLSSEDVYYGINKLDVYYPATKK